MKDTIRLLIVDSKSSSIKTVSKVLASAPQIQTVGFATSGYESITKAIALKPDVVYMNIHNESEFSGIYACREINNNVPDTRVILHGQSMREEYIYKAFQMGAVNVLVGDYFNHDIIEAIVEAHDGKASIHHSTADSLRREFQRLMDLNDNMVYVLNVLVKLTPTEIDILRHFYNGMSSTEIRKIMFIASSTMKTHISHILKKFNLESMAQVVEALHSTDLFSILNPARYDDSGI